MKPVQLYRQLAELPTYVTASFLGPRGTHVRNLCVTFANDSLRLALRVVTSVRDHTNNRKRTIVKTIALPVGDEEPVIVPQEQAESVIASTVSRSGARIGILKEGKEGDKTKRQVEIWRGSAAEAILDVTKEHGEFYGDGSLLFSACSPTPSDNVCQIPSHPSPFHLLKIHCSTRQKGTPQKKIPATHSGNSDSSRPLENGSLVASGPLSLWLNGAKMNQFVVSVFPTPTEYNMAFPLISALRPSVRKLRMSCSLFSTI